MESSVEASQTTGVSNPKPALAPKPRLAPKPFSLQTNTTIRSIHAPKSGTELPHSGKAEAATVPKPALPAAPLKPSTSVSATTKEQGSPTKETTSQPGQDASNRKSNQVPQTTLAKESVPLKKDDAKENNQKTPADIATKLEQRDEKKKDDTSAHDTEKLEESGSDVANPAHRWGSTRKRLSMELTSRFESGGGPPPAPSNITKHTSSTKHDVIKAESMKPEQNQTTPELPDREVEDGSPKEDYVGGGSIKRRISQLFESRPEVAVKREEPEMINGSGGVKAKIKNWAIETVTDSKPQFVPRPRSKSNQTAAPPPAEKTPETPPAEPPASSSQVVDLPSASLPVKQPTEVGTSYVQNSLTGDGPPLIQSQTADHADETDSAGKAGKRDNSKRRSVHFGVVEKDDGGPPVILGSESDSSSEDEEKQGRENAEDDISVLVPVYKRVGLFQKDSVDTLEAEKLHYLEFEKNRRAQETEEATHMLEELRRKEKEEQQERERERERLEREQERVRLEEREKERLRQEDLERHRKELEIMRLEEEEREKERLRQKMARQSKELEKNRLEEEKERMRQEEMERQRKELERKRLEEEKERMRQEEMERQRKELERIRLEKEKERMRQEEMERQRKELERKRLEEEKERMRQEEMERQRKELERKRLEEEKEKERLRQEMERQRKELERMRLEEEKEKERMRQEMERQRKELERMRLEEEKEKERMRQEMERQRKESERIQLEEEKERMRQEKMERQRKELERKRLEEEKEKERIRQEMERQRKELERMRLEEEERKNASLKQKEVERHRMELEKIMMEEEGTEKDRLEQEEMERHRKEWERVRWEEEHIEKENIKEEEMERERQIHQLWHRQREEERERMNQKEEDIKQGERESERVWTEREGQRLREEEERVIHESDEHKFEAKLRKGGVNKVKKREEEWEKHWVSKVEKLKEENREEEDLRLMEQSEKEEEREKYTRLTEEQEVERRQKENRRQIEEVRAQQDILISFDSDNVSSKPSYSHGSPLLEPPEASLEVVYEDFSIKKNLVQVEFDDFSVKPMKWGVHLRDERSPIIQGEGADASSGEEEEEEEEMDVSAFKWEYKVREQIENTDTRETAPAPEREEEEEQLISSKEVNSPFNTKEEPEKEEEKEEDAYDIKDDVSEEAEDDSCTNVEEGGTFVLIDSVPDEHNEASEQASESGSPNPESDQHLEISSEDFDTADFHSEADIAPFPESSTPLLDSSAQKSKSSLSKRRSRTRPSRSFRAGLTQDESPDWRTSDSTEVSSKQRESDSEDEQPRQKIFSPHPTSQRVPIFPGLSPAALIAQIKRKTSGRAEEAVEDNGGGEKEEGAAPSPSQLSSSPRTAAHLTGAARVLPPIAGTDDGATACPPWLQELKSKKRLSQYDSEP